MVVLVVAVTLLVAAGGGVFLVPAVLTLTPERGSSRRRAAALLRGGLMIGLLERLAVAGSIFTGHPEGIAVVVAVKGLGRYPEIRSAASGVSASPVSQPSADPGNPAVGERRPARAGGPPAKATGETRPSTSHPATSGPRTPTPDELTELGAAVSERFIIGTLASYVWAAVCAAGGLWWLSALG